MMKYWRGWEKISRNSALWKKSFLIFGSKLEYFMGNHLINFIKSCPKITNEGLKSLNQGLKRLISWKKISLELDK